MVVVVDKVRDGLVVDNVREEVGLDVTDGGGVRGVSTREKSIITIKKWQNGLPQWVKHNINYQTSITYLSHMQF